MRSITRWQMREALLTFGLIILSVATLFIGKSSEYIVLRSEQVLSQYWRTTYDILVRPSGARSAIEKQYNLVEPNFISNLAGGITISQYEAVKTIPGVEIAAPEGLLTYIWLPLPNRVEDFREEAIPIAPGIWLGRGEFSGIYLEEITASIQDGVEVHKMKDYCYFAVISEIGDITPNLHSLGKVDCLNQEGRTQLPPFLGYPLGFIDPEEEAKLIGLEKAMIEGRYLIGRESVQQESWEGFNVIEIPVLINITPYISQTLSFRLSQVLVPESMSVEEAVEEGLHFIEKLPTRVVVEREFDNIQIIHSMVSQGLQKGTWENTYSILAKPLPRHYQEVTSPFHYDGLVLEVESTAPYRLESIPIQQGAVRVLRLRVQGIFDVERLPVEPNPINRVPLGMYIPPVATLRYDERGHPTEPAILRPTPFFTGPVLSPPLALTTLEAARLIAGDDCISAIRVRVGGIDQLTPEAQRKIEAVASEIHRKTGLDVDIMVGSSPRRVLVHVPGIGYVEEQWVQKNVTLSYHRRIQSGHLLLIAALLVTGGLFAADMAWADLLARQRVLALQKALGWRSASLMGQVLRRALLTGLGAGVGGAAIAVGALALARQPLPSLLWLLGIPLLVTTLSVLGSLYPALQAARVPPIPLLQMAGLRHRAGRPERARGRSGGPLLPVRYALLGVARRWSRSLLAGMTAALSAGLLVLLVGVVADQAGYLSGTLLGEYILVQVEGYHWMLVGVGLALAAAGMGNSLLAGVLERRREIGVLKALGWRTGAVARLFLLEGAVLGLLGGLAGTALGLSVYLALYRSVGAGLLGAVAAGLGVPVAVGVLAAAYPARVAARVPPAEAVRGE